MPSESSGAIERRNGTVMKTECSSWVVLGDRDRPTQGENRGVAAGASLVLGSRYAFTDLGHVLRES